MARNEEKQQGRLNRLWLQKEREEGRLKDVHERRPKLSTLNSASSVKKWIPSIKNEIEYYLQSLNFIHSKPLRPVFGWGKRTHPETFRLNQNLKIQQSQLSHYPERKIAEFQLHIEALEKEYKSFITKLRILDPTCKHKPWTPRAYCKRRADTEESPSIAKTPRLCESHDGSSKPSEGERDFGCIWTGSDKTSERQEPVNHFPTPPEAVCADQDQPLSFDQTRLAVATAAFRGPALQQGSSETKSLARVLQSRLPNLVNTSLRHTLSTQSRDKDFKGAMMGSIGQKSDVQDRKSDYEAMERIPGRSSTSGTTEERAGHVLGLDCYSSSDEECDT